MSFRMALSIVPTYMWALVLEDVGERINHGILRNILTMICK